MEDCSSLCGHKGATAVRERLEGESDSTLCTGDVTGSQWERVELLLPRISRWWEVEDMYLQIYEEKHAEKQRRGWCSESERWRGNIWMVKIVKATGCRGSEEVSM